ncbi:pyridoxal phosphate-dependent aminotransferase [Streptomyces alboniger]|uniref:Aminotransferase n=1 Tax=Streptomyces alboniger TaxID=132473 RepID=A0A5J6HE49_STRAD|nr:aminotransferase class I/II-fold pyridoxal phosphate-dependent enzyme [Streptomyces alboniger]QEV16631.1 aminotransferase class I/II-fold pyridoxal phosphate-dependent enzyme [Streptomyces alboniger]
MSTAYPDVVDLASGQIVEPLSPAVRAAFDKALDSDRTSAYAPAYGDPDLRTAVADHYAVRTGTPVDPEHITVTAGARHGLLVALSTVAHGGEVLVPRPHWSHYPAVVRRAGARPVPVDGGAGTGWRVGPAELEAARTERTRALLLNSPVNPTGAVYDESRVRALREWAGAHGICLITDDIYWAYGDAVDRGVRASAHEIVVGGASKVYALAGLRVGWVWGAPELSAALRDAVEYTTGPVCGTSQLAAAAALRETHAVAARVGGLAARREAAVRIMTGIPLLEPVAPAGGIYLCLDATEALSRQPHGARDDVALCRVLAERAGVRLRAGSTFGMPGHLRLCVAEEADTLAEAARRLSGFLTTFN